MTNWLVKIFVKDYENVSDENVRKRYGFLSSIVGIVCNIILFGVKYLMGTLSGSVAIISDGFNNLSDSGSCIFTLFGYRMAAKPADKDHPFGHGRMEYLISLVIATVIMLVGFELLKSSFAKVIHPEEVQFSVVALVVLIISVLVKLWMSLFNRKLGLRINSMVMLATSKDSASDMLSTIATIIALVASKYTKLPVDGVIGCIVSVLVLYSGFGIIKDTIDELLGKPAAKETKEALSQIMNSEPLILGIHDLVLHTYGPGVTFGSVHVEVEANQDIMLVHDVIDVKEREVYEKLGIVLTVHMDPINTNDENVARLKEMVKNILADIDSKITFHDFRVVTGITHTNLIFDVVLPYDVPMSDKEVIRCIDERLEKMPEKYYSVICVDREYT